jgi:hypothetical protein
MLTLYVTPVVYTYMDAFQERLWKLFPGARSQRKLALDMAPPNPGNPHDEDTQE